MKKDGIKVVKIKKNKYWSREVVKRSDVLDMEPGVFTWSDSKKIARSLKRSVLKSIRRKAPPFQSAMSMLNFYINRAGKNLSPGGAGLFSKKLKRN